MSELKVYVPQDGIYGLELEEGGLPVEEETCYLKSEADRYISELIADQQLELDDWYCKVQHHKFKRCLAMAKWCERKRIDAANYRIPRQKWDFYDKWHKRWMELAEKFKEAK